nr:EexN family lipoprotein [uncultured Celeribacter sp.]
MKQILLFAALVALSACKDDVKEAQTVQYYVDHPEARQEMIDVCEVKDGSELDADCVNARDALLSATSAKNLEDLDKYFGDTSSGD